MKKIVSVLLIVSLFFGTGVRTAYSAKLKPTVISEKEAEQLKGLESNSESTIMTIVSGDDSDLALAGLLLVVLLVALVVKVADDNKTSTSN